MANIIDRYAGAVHSRNLKSDARTAQSDSDVVAAMGLADRTLSTGWQTTGPDEGYPVKPSKLAVPLERLFAGDHGVAHEIVRILVAMVFDKSWDMQVKITRMAASNMACACLAWHRSGSCKSCGGHGYDLIPGVPSLSSHECRVCHGTGKILLERQFKPAHQELVRWLVAEMTREAGRAGPAAMRSLVPTLEL
jgi:hypothetical protein